MSEVFVVTHETPYDPPDVLGVYTSLRTARRAAIDRWNFGTGTVEVEQFELTDTNTWVAQVWDTRDNKPYDWFTAKSYAIDDEDDD